MPNTIKVLRVTTEYGVFYSADQERAEVVSLRGVLAVEEMQMPQEEYDDIPATTDAARFFAGKIVGSRA